MIILINAISLHAGGGKVVGLGIIEALSKIISSEDKMIVVAPGNNGYEKYSSNNVEITTCSKQDSLKYKVLFSSFFNKYIKQYTPDIILNLCDLPFKTQVSQTIFFHHPFIVYPESKVWKMLKVSSKLTEKYKLYLFKKNLNYSLHFFAQTINIKNRLHRLYNISEEKISLTPTAVRFTEFKKTQNKLISDTKAFLYLTRYYEHKNIEILLEVAELIKKQKLNYKIILTINETDHSNVPILLQKIKDSQISDVIINKGFVNYNKLPQLYSDVDAIIMPTLLESLSTTYLEAMYFEKPIFTSNFDFATCVCGEVAIYFDPFNAMDILNKMKQIDNTDKMQKLIINGQNELKKYPTNWIQPATHIYNVLKSLIN